jgi:hypothetical protein
MSCLPSVASAPAEERVRRLNLLAPSKFSADCYIETKTQVSGATVRHGSASEAIFAAPDELNTTALNALLLFFIETCKLLNPQGFGGTGHGCQTDSAAATGVAALFASG